MSPLVDAAMAGCRRTGRLPGPGTPAGDGSPHESHPGRGHRLAPPHGPALPCSFAIVLWGVLTQKKPFAGE